MSELRRVLSVALIVGVSVVLGACSSGQDAGDPTGVEWVLTQAGTGDVDLSAIGITAQFADGQLAGFSGVNQYSGPYAIDDGGSFEAGPFAGTLMAGPAALMKAEEMYLSLLDECDSYAVKDDTLVLSTDGETTLVFEQAEPVEIAESAWTVTGYNNGKEAVVSVSADATLTLVFSGDGTVSGNAGVNTYTGPYETSGNTVKIGPLATTRMAGPEELMTQETLFLEALQNASTWGVVQRRLELRDESGAMQVTATTP